jgi:hypothetical protein
MGDSDSRRKLWKSREENNLCIYCGVNSPNEGKKGCKKCLELKSKKTSEFAINNKHKVKQYNLLVKHQVIEKYGGKCFCCGESEVLFLTIDHKNNDGFIERKNNNISNMSFYLRLRKEEIREDLQILCWNCNLGKSVNNGVCPHIEIKRKLDNVYDRRNIPQFDTRLKIVWPNDDELIKMCNDESVSQVAKKLGVDFSSVSGRLKRRNKYHLVKMKKGGVKYGENNKSSKLTIDQVNKIRKENSEGVSRKDLAIKYNVSKSLIDKIINNLIWN